MNLDAMKHPTIRIFTLIVMLGLLAFSGWTLWQQLKPIQSRIADLIEVVRTDPDPEDRRQAMEKLWRIDERDQPPLTPVIVRTTEILQPMQAAGRNYDKEFGFFLWVVQFLAKHDRDGKSLPLLKALHEYEPKDNIITGYKVLQQHAMNATLEIGVRKLKRQVDDIEERAIRPIAPDGIPPAAPTITTP
jgi:hypothetical protein